jgi:HEAT repeat protein
MDTDKQEKDTPTLVQPVIDALLDIDHVFPARYLPFFSDISEKGFKAVREAWPLIPVERRISLLSDLELAMESDSLLSYDTLAKFALNDDEPNVRSRAISLMWESDDPDFLDSLVEILESDPSDLVQVSAAAGLGRFVLMGELDEIPRRLLKTAVSALQKKQAGKPSKVVQQEILKSLAYTSSIELNRQIEQAHTDPDPTWKLTAVIAMGRTADERWESKVLRDMESDTTAIQNEAVKAAGEIELESARLPLLDMLESGISDLELRLHVIWALARIGGEDVRESLQALMEEADDEEEIDVIEMALEHLEFSEELPDLDL